MAGANAKGEMEVERAKLREMAYRHRAARLGLLSENPSQDLVPMKAPSSSYQERASKPMPSQNNFQTSQPLPLPSPHPNRPPNLFPKPPRPQTQIQKPIKIQISRPNLSGTKRKEILTNSQNQVPQKPKPSPSQPDYVTTTPDGYSYCNMCEVPCPSRFNLQQHLNGNQHKNKMQLLEWNKKGVSRPFCETCQIYCQDEGALQMHYNGQKHKAKLQKLEDGGEKKYHRTCDLCKIFCMDEGIYQQHLRGKNHLARVAAENKEGCW